MAPLLLSDRLVRLRDKLSRKLAPMDRARVLKQMLQYCESIETWGKCEQDEPMLSACLWPLSSETVTGDKTHSRATFDGITFAQATAVRDYSADGENGQYQKINTYHRLVAKGERLPPLDKKEGTTSKELDKMFLSFPGLSAPIRVYRGLSSPRLALKTVQEAEYHDAGFTSTSSDLLPAMVYAKDAKVVLVIELPPGFKAVSICDISRNPQEKEILLPRGVLFEAFDPPKEYNGFTLLHMRPAHERVSA